MHLCFQGFFGVAQWLQLRELVDVLNFLISHLKMVVYESYDQKQLLAIKILKILNYSSLLKYKITLKSC
jgi:hypothetical protein